jgi:hypothetical protein
VGVEEIEHEVGGRDRLGLVTGHGYCRLARLDSPVTTMAEHHRMHSIAAAPSPRQSANHRIIADSSTGTVESITGRKQVIRTSDQSNRDIDVIANTAVFPSRRDEAGAWP